METTEYRLRIRDLPEDERPLERLDKYGPQALKTSELIAIIIRTGTSTATAVQVAEQLLQKYDGNLKRLADNSGIQIAEGIKGLGTVKVGQIKAAFELGRRMAAFLRRNPKLVPLATLCMLHEWRCLQCEICERRNSTSFALIRKTM